MFPTAYYPLNFFPESYFERGGVPGPTPVPVVTSPVATGGGGGLKGSESKPTKRWDTEDWRKIPEPERKRRVSLLSIGLYTNVGGVVFKGTPKPPPKPKKARKPKPPAPARLPVRALVPSVGRAPGVADVRLRGFLAPKPRFSRPSLYPSVGIVWFQPSVLGEMLLAGARLRLHADAPEAFSKIGSKESAQLRRQTYELRETLSDVLELLVNGKDTGVLNRLHDRHRRDRLRIAEEKILLESGDPDTICERLLELSERYRAGETV